MTDEQLRRGRIISERIKNLEKAIQRIEDAVDSTKTSNEHALDLYGVPMFGGTSPLLQDCGFKSEVILKEVVDVFTDILQVKIGRLKRDFEDL